MNARAVPSDSGAGLAPTPARGPASDAGSGTLSVRNLTKAYERGKPVLHGIDLDFPGRGVVAIIGPSGTGKSTLIRCINRLVEPTSGSVMLGGRDLTKLGGRALREARREIGMVFQEYNLVERLSVMENLLCGRLGYVPLWRVWTRRYPQADIDRAFALLDRVGLGEFASRRADALSGGQRQRVGIARALMQTPRVLLADEPTSSLDPRTSVEIMTLMRDLAAEQGIPVVINIHDVALAKRFADRIVGMAGGRVVFDGPPEALADAHLHEIYGAGEESWIG
ncbi:phosphonate ABC transporter ATP-binding protein [Salinarimonas sp.]|uniref:phosphonate ABC transporter ATP-binding protein n=1 Tax=Salinarimonas sp. TaxID=2766526 RepID=UPI00391A207E